MYSLIQEDRSAGVTAPNNYGLENYLECDDLMVIWYFVIKIVLTYSEKKIVLVIENCF